MLLATQVGRWKARMHGETRERPKLGGKPDSSWKCGEINPTQLEPSSKNVHPLFLADLGV